jgi:hypothetical protein
MIFVFSPPEAEKKKQIKAQLVFQYYLEISLYKDIYLVLLLKNKSKKKEIEISLIHLERIRDQPQVHLYFYLCTRIRTNIDLPFLFSLNSKDM